MRRHHWPTETRLQTPHRRMTATGEWLAAGQGFAREWARQRNQLAASCSYCATRDRLMASYPDQGMHHNVDMLQPPAAILFDMDGTLIESHANVERAWEAWAISRGLDPAAVVATAHGLPADTTVARWLPGANDEAIAAAAAEQLQLQYDDVAGIELIEGVAPLLTFLDDVALPWAIYTSADAELARVRLAAAGITPTHLVTRDQVSNGKPAPDGYLRAAEILGAPAADCIVIEDTDVGIAAGRAAGMATVGVRGAIGDLPLRSISDLHLWLTVLIRSNEEGEPIGLPF